MRRALLLVSLCVCGFAFAAMPDAATFGPPGNPDDQIRAFWHPTVSFYTNLFENGFNTLIVHHMGEYNVKRDCCPNANIPADRNRWLDICQERGIAFVEKLTLTEGFARAGTFPLRTSKGTEKGGHADATNPEFLVACSNALAKILAQYPDHPAVFGVQASSEVRDHAAPADQPWFRARYRKATGREVPAGAENRNPPMYDQIDDFPVGRIVGPDYPLWAFYRWWWKDGDGWNAYQTAMARQFAAHFSHPVAAFYDPVVRTPPIWGSGGDVTFGNQWTYPYPQPYKVLYVVSEQQAMARGNPGQGVTTMLQGISYRSAIAPKEETPAVHPKWHDEFPNTSYPTTPAALMREGVWSALARKIDGIMFFAGAALFDLSSEAKDYDEYRKRAYYQHCDPETMPVVNGIFRDVAVPLGPLLRAVPERPMEVAVLESAPSVVFARTGTWGAGSDIAVAAAGAGLQPQTLYDEDVARDGIPASLKVLMLPKCAVMEETTVRAIRDWQVRTEGVVLADGDLVPAILPDGSLPEIAAETEGVACAAAFREGGRKLLEALAPSYRPYASATADIIPYVRTFRDADYVFAINDRRGYGDYVGAWKRVLDKGLPNKGAVRVSRAAGAVYDLVRHVAVPFTVKDGVTEIPVEYETNDGRLLMLTSRPLGELTVSVEDETVTVTSSDRDVMIPIEICRTGKRPHYAVVRDGVFSRKLDGTEGLEVRSLATGEWFGRQSVGGLWTPESQGLSSRAILRWVDHADRTGGFQSFVLMRHGKTLAEGWWSPCETNGTHLLYSLSKSFTSTAVGMLADERKLDLDERLADIFPEVLPSEPSANLLSMRVRDLLTMTTGHTNNSFKAFAAASDGDWRRAFMACPVPLRPGMRFLYDSGATYMLSSVVGRRSGQRMSDYLRSRLFDPLGIGPVVWNRSPQGDDVGGSELYLSTRDMAKFGQLWLQQGEWKGRRLLSRDYVRLASSRQTNSGLASFEGQDVREDWNAGYGFQFWMCRHNAFRGAGAYGQFVIVMRDQDAVMAINSNTSMQNTLESVWTHLLAEMKDRPLAEDPDGVAALRNRTASLARPTVEGGRVGATDGFGPHLDRASDLKVTFAAADDGWTLSMSNAEWQVSVPVGYRRWNRGVAYFAATTSCGGRLVGAQQVAASGAWQSPTEFRARLVFVQTPHDAEVAIRIGERGDLTVSCASANVSNARISKTTLKRFQ